MTQFPATAILPLTSNATPLERAVARVNERIPLLLDPDEIRRAKNPLLADPRWLPLLAWERSVDEWDNNWSVDQKRAAILASYPIHQHKGTVYALKRALATLNLDAKLTEWFQYGGQPYRFRVSMTVGQLDTFTLEFYSSVTRVVFAAKNVRSYLEALELKRSGIAGPIYVASYIKSKHLFRHTYDELSYIGVKRYLYAGAGLINRMKLVVGLPVTEIGVTGIKPTSFTNVRSLAPATVSEAATSTVSIGTISCNAQLTH